MFERNSMAGIGLITDANRKELSEKLHELGILNASKKGLYTENEIQNYLKKSMAADFDISAFMECIRTLKIKGIFKVHPNVSGARDQRRLELETDVKALTYQQSLLSVMSCHRKFDESKVVENLACHETFDTSIFSKVLQALQNAKIIFPVHIT